MTLRAKEIYEEIKQDYGTMMDQAAIARMLGRKTSRRMDAFLAGLPCFDINGRKRWRASDLAQRIADCELLNDD